MSAGLRLLVLGAAVVLAAACSSRDEVARMRSPSGELDAVVFETNAGATTSFGYEVILVPSGRSAFWGKRAAKLYGAIRSTRAYGVNLKRRSSDVLEIEYLEARSAQLESQLPITINNRSVSVALVGGINDPTACAGGMLHTLQMSNLNGDDCRMTGR